MVAATNYQQPINFRSMTKIRQFLLLQLQNLSYCFIMFSLALDQVPLIVAPIENFVNEL